MLTVTESAKQHLKQLLLANTDDPDLGVRLTVDRLGKIELVLDRPTLGDQVVEHEGSKVLLVAQELTEMVTGATVDTKDTPDGTRLVISRA